jgi:hypothetical protein
LERGRRKEYKRNDERKRKQESNGEKKEIEKVI